LSQEQFANHFVGNTVQSKELQKIKFPFRFVNSVENGCVDPS